MRKVLLLTVLGLSIFLFSCKIQVLQVGNYKNQEGKPSVIYKGKDFYMFWDNVPIQKSEKKVKITDYEKIVKRNIFDNVIYYGTIGIFSFYSVEIKTKESIGDVKSNETIFKQKPE